MADHTTERVTLTRLPSGVEVATTVHTYGTGAGGDPATAEGPTVYVQAAQHGREINGAEVLRRVHRRLRDADLAGTVVAVPVADPLTFDRVSYTTPEQLDSVNANMNRVWPGDAEGTLHERMAAALWTHVSTADAVVDLHTGSPEMLTHVIYMYGHEPSRRLAEAFGTDLHLAEAADDDAEAEWAERDFGGKLRVAAAREGIPAITPELAHNRELVEPAIETGIDGTLDVLRELALLPGDPDPDGDPTVAKNHLGRVRAADSGLFRANDALALGADVEEGTNLGTLYDPTSYAVLQEARADREGILYSLSTEVTVTAGASLGRVAERR